jgi:agmatine deiminase
MPAEWEPHVATWLAWPHQAGDWPGKLDAVRWVFVEIARVLSQAERVRLIVGGKLEQRRAARMLERSGCDLGRIDFHLAATDRSWTRDFLPLFVVPGARARSKRIASVKWRFNGWARYPNHERDDAAGRSIAAQYGRPWFEPSVERGARRMHIVLEGGAIDVDGRGTAMVTEECLIAGKRARNRWLGRDGTERVLGDYLGIEKTLWVSRGIAGDDTSGHIDDFARFVAPSKVVICAESDRRDDNYLPLRQAAAALRHATDARDRKLELVELPMPRPVMYGRQRLPASYANFYIGNAAVLVPTFNDPADRIALDIFARLFPDRKVVGIYCRDLVLGLGTIHCSTQQEPALPKARRNS